MLAKVTSGRFVEWDHLRRVLTACSCGNDMSTGGTDSVMGGVRGPTSCHVQSLYLVYVGLPLNSPSVGGLFVVLD